MNVTPLIDVLLVLIIVFMVVVIEQRSTGLQAEIPQQPSPTGNPIPPPQRTIVIQIHHAKPGVEHPQVMVVDEAQGRHQHAWHDEHECDRAGVVAQLAHHASSGCEGLAHHALAGLPKQLEHFPRAVVAKVCPVKRSLPWTR